MFFGGPSRKSKSSRGRLSPATTHQHARRHAHPPKALVRLYRCPRRPGSGALRGDAGTKNTQPAARRKKTRPVPFFPSTHVAQRVGGHFGGQALVEEDAPVLEEVGWEGGCEFFWSQVARRPAAD